MRIQLLGDSLFARREGAPEAMISYLLKQRIANLVVYNAAVSGYNSHDLLAQALQLQQVEPCDYLFVLIGTNDLALNKQVPLPDFRANLYRLSKVFDGHYRTEQIVFLTPLPVDERKQHYRHNGLVMAYGQVIQAFCQEKGYGCIDTYALFLAKAKEVPLSVLLEGAMDDGLHFGQSGYNILVEALCAYLEE